MPEQMSSINNLPFLEERLTQAEESSGVKVLQLQKLEIGDQSISLVHVRIAPGAQVSAHLHERGGELYTFLTDVTMYLGEAARDGQGNYLKGEDDKTQVNNWIKYDLRAGETRNIPEGTVHYFVNQSADHYADFQSFTPTTHVTRDANGKVIDKVDAVNPIL